MPQPNDELLCAGNRCPSATNCKRYADRATKTGHIQYAAFWARRDPGSDSCDSMRPVKIMSTYKD